MKPGLLDVEIRTARLLLVPVSMVYREEIFQTFTPEITTYMHPRPAERIEETEAFINRSLEELREGSDLVLVILNRRSREFLGCGGLHGVQRPDPELGIWIKKIGPRQRLWPRGDAGGQRVGGRKPGL